MTTFEGFDFQELSTSESLEELRPEWLAVWHRSELSTPFQSPDWLIPWWRHIGEGQLQSLAIRRGAQIVGIAPLYLYVRPQTSVRELFPLGIATTDYLDVICEPRFASAAAVALFKYLDG